MNEPDYEKAVDEDRETRKLPREQLPVHMPRDVRRRCKRVGHVYARTLLGAFVCKNCGETPKGQR